jgi:NDP-sugar pyrophosphorylase family protein
LETYSHKELFNNVKNVWEVIKKIASYIEKTISPNLSWLYGVTITDTIIIKDGHEFEGFCDITFENKKKSKLKVIFDNHEVKGASVIYAGATIFDKNIYIGEGTVVEPGALIKGPTIIGNNCEIRRGAYIRGKCLIGDNCVVGHSTEMKNSVMLNGSKASHFGYVGDSILGNNANLGAGTKLANLKMDNREIEIRVGNEKYPSKLKKLGAILGDNVETGCNSVCNPGTLIGKSSIVYPCINVPSRYYSPNSKITSGLKKPVFVQKLNRKLKP